MATITTEQINEFLKNMIDENGNDKNVVEVDWAFGKAKVTKYLPLSQMVEIATSVANVVFNDATGEYAPEILDTIFWCYIIRYYTDIDLPEDVELQQAVILYTDIKDIICENVSDEQIGEIRCAIDERIKNIIDSGNNVLARAMLDAHDQMVGLSKEFSDTINMLKTIGVDVMSDKQEEKQEDEPKPAVTAKKRTSKK